MAAQVGWDGIARLYSVRVDVRACQPDVGDRCDHAATERAKVDQQRLERLASWAGRSPKALLRFVLRDGFEEVERDILETLAAERDMSIDGTARLHMQR